MIKSVLFDFDGVIHDTFSFHLTQIEQFLGKTVNPQELRDVHNGNFYATDIAWARATNWLDYAAFVGEKLELLTVSDEVKNLLVEVAQKYELFVVTSGFEKNINRYLANNDMLALFQEVCGYEHGMKKVDKFKEIFLKYNILPEECLFVTDTLGDVLEAHEAGIKTAAVDFGYHNRDTLNRGNPEYIISHLEELLPIIDSYEIC